MLDGIVVSNYLRGLALLNFKLLVLFTTTQYFVYDIYIFYGKYKIYARTKSQSIYLFEFFLQVCEISIIQGRLHQNHCHLLVTQFLHPNLSIHPLKSHREFLNAYLHFPAFQKLPLIFRCLSR